MGRDETLYWWGQSTSALGSVFTAVALPIMAVVYLHATPGQIAVISASSIVPALLLGLPAGALADRIARPRRTLILLDTVSALAVAAVAVGLATHTATLAWLAALGLIDGAVTVLIEVVYFLHLRQLVSTDGLGPARARLQAGQYGAGFAGRLLVGPVIVLFGPAAALAVDVVSYLVSVMALMSMRPIADATPGHSPAAKEHPLSGLTAGARYFLADRFHRILLAMIVVPVVAGSGAGVLIAPFLLRVVRVPTSVYGLVFAVGGLAGLAGSAVAARWFTPDRDPRRIVTLTFAATVVCGLPVPLALGPLPVAMGCVALGMALPAFFGAIANVALGPVIVGDAPEHIVGRVVAMLQVLAGAGGLAGTFLGGWLGDSIGVRTAMWTLGGTAAVFVLLALPMALRSDRRAPDTEAAVNGDSVLARTTG